MFLPMSGVGTWQQIALGFCAINENLVGFVHQGSWDANSAEASSVTFASNIETDCSSIELKIRNGGIADSCDMIF